MVWLPPELGQEAIERIERWGLRRDALIDEAIGLVKAWPILVPGDQAKARRELESLVRDYDMMLSERNAGRVAAVAEELEVLRDCAAALHNRLNHLSPGARKVLDRAFSAEDKALFSRAGGEMLPPMDEGEFVNCYPVTSGEHFTEFVGPGLWQESTQALSAWAGRKASGMRKKAKALGRKTLDDVLLGETSQDWLLKKCKKWMEAHEWEPTKRVRLARLIHEAATGEKPSDGQFREAGARAQD